MDKDFLIVHKSILPDCYSKVIAARKLIESGRCRDVSQAVREAGISRSTYYKYSKYVFEVNELGGGHTAIVSVILHNKTGALRSLLTIFSEAGCSVITINQSLPIHGMASVVVTLDTTLMKGNIDELLDSIRSLDAAEKIKLMAIE